MAKRKKKLAVVESIQQELSDEEVVQIFTEMHAEADDAYLPQKNVADTAWAAYNNNFDFSDKGDSQSQSFLPLYKSAIRVAKSIVRRSLLEAPQYFAVEGLNPESRALEQDVHDGLLRITDQAGFREEVANASFAGLLEHLAVLKIFPVQIGDEDEIISAQQQIKLRVAPVSVPNDFRLDPKGRGLYVLHRSELDLSDYEALVDSGDYERASLEAAKADFSSKDEDFRKQSTQGLSDTGKPAWRKTVELWEVWTRALCRSDGTSVRRNVTFTVLNKKFLARKPRPYLYRHNLPPFVWSPVADKPFSVYHENFGEPVLGMLDAIIDLMNSLVDAAQNVATKGFEISMDQVRNAGEISRGIYGGKVIKTSTPPIPGLSTVRPFDVGTFSPDAFQFMTWMVQQFHNGIGVTELLSGIPGAGEKTATEINQKTQAAMGNLNEVAGLLDHHLISPALRMMYQLMLEWNPEIFGDRLAFQTSKDKLKFRFHISGISGALKKQGDLQQLLSVIQTLMQTPLASRLNWDYVGEELLRRNGFKPEDFLLSQVAQNPEPGMGATPPQQEAQTSKEQMLAQMMNMKQ